MQLENIDVESLTEFFQIDIDHQKLLHNIVDQICGKPIKLSRPEEIGVVEFSDAIILLKAIIQNSIRQNLSSKKIKSEITKKYSLDEKFVPIITEVIQARRDELKSKFSMDTTNLISDNYLEDFDWKLHVVMASNYMSQQQSEPLLLLTLIINNANEKRREYLIELSKKDLDRFLNTLGEIKTRMQEVTVNVSQ